MATDLPGGGREQEASEVLPTFASPELLQDYTKGKIKSNEPRVLPALEAVSGEIRREAGWHVWPLVRNQELVLDGSGGRVQSVPTLNLLAVKAAASAGVDLPVDALDFSALGLIKIPGRIWTDRYGQVRLTIDHGFPAVPELRGLCLSLTARALASPLGATREQAGSLSVNWGMSSSVSGSILPTASEIATINRYRSVEA